MKNIRRGLVSFVMLLVALLFSSFVQATTIESNSHSPTVIEYVVPTVNEMPKVIKIKPMVMASVGVQSQVVAPSKIIPIAWYDKRIRCNNTTSIIEQLNRRVKSFDVRPQNVQLSQNIKIIEVIL